MNGKAQEYERLQEELVMRVNKCYGDGALLTSFYLIYYATVVFGLLEWFFNGKDGMTCIEMFVFAVLACILFVLLILILYAFSVKFKENYLSICNISAYIIFCHELPTVIKRDEGNLKKWELTHYDTVFGEEKYETKEYFLLALTSVFLLFGSLGIEIYCFFSYFKHIPWMLLLGCIYIIVLIFSVIFTRRIGRATNIQKLQETKKNIICYYIDLYVFEHGEKKRKKICNGF